MRQKGYGQKETVLDLNATDHSASALGQVCRKRIGPQQTPQNAWPNYLGMLPCGGLCLYRALICAQVKICKSQQKVAYTLEVSPGSEQYSGHVQDIATGMCSGFGQLN